MGGSLAGTRGVWRAVNLPSGQGGKRGGRGEEEHARTHARTRGGGGGQWGRWEG